MPLLKSNMYFFILRIPPKEHFPPNLYFPYINKIELTFLFLQNLLTFLFPEKKKSFPKVAFFNSGYLKVITTFLRIVPLSN